MTGAAGYGTANDWQGRVGDAWAREWQRTDRSFAGLSPQLNAAILTAAPDNGRAIDLGCGAGETSIALAKARPGVSVTGIDLSEDLIAVARERGAGIANLSFGVGDTTKLAPDTAADLFVSRHGVMFFDDPVAAFTHIRHAGAPDARIVFSCFADRARNPWACLFEDEVAPPPPGYTPGPFGFADRDWTAAMLAKAGWTDAQATAIDYTYVAGAGDNPVPDAIAFFSRIGPIARTLAEAAPDVRTGMMERLANTLAAHESEGQIKFAAATWIWTARAGEAA